MRAILGGLFTIFAITATITHIWTVIIAYEQAGLSGCLITLFLPVISEIYWMFKMFGENNLYATIALVHTLLAGLYATVGKE